MTTNRRAAHTIVGVLDALGLERHGRPDDPFYLCPLQGHQEKTPSFHVLNPGTPEERFYCFGCQRGGDLYTLVKELKPELKAKLRAVAPGLENLRARKGDPKVHRIIEINERAATIFFSELPKCPQVIEYLKQRGANPMTAKIGLGTDAAYNQLTQEFTVEELREAGLISRENTRYFAGRIIVPVVRNKRVIGFSARELPRKVGCPAMPEDPMAGRKYVNSPSTAAFQKKALLSEGFEFHRVMTRWRAYLTTIACHFLKHPEVGVKIDAGLWDCRRALRKPPFDVNVVAERVKRSEKHIKRLIPYYLRQMVQNTSVVVEGIFDQIVLQEYGVPAVSFLGLGGPETYRKIAERAKTGQVLLVLDGDAAGSSAVFSVASFIFRRYKETEVPPENIGVVYMPEGKDPDEFIIRENGLTDFLTMTLTQANLVRATVELAIREALRYESRPERRRFLLGQGDHGRAVRDAILSIPPTYRPKAHKLINQKVGLALFDGSTNEPPVRRGPIPSARGQATQYKRGLSDSEVMARFIRSIAPRLSEAGKTNLVALLISSDGRWLAEKLCSEYPIENCDEFVLVTGKNGMDNRYYHRMRAMLMSGDKRTSTMKALRVFTLMWIVRHRHDYPGRTYQKTPPALADEVIAALQQKISSEGAEKGS